MGKRAAFIACFDDVSTCPEEWIKDIVPLLRMVGDEIVSRPED